MLIKIHSAAAVGIDAVPITIEVHATAGFDFTLVGLPDNAVKEAHERIVSALMVNGYETPKRMITINMSPADIKKEGAAYDLPLAVGMLIAAEELKRDRIADMMIMGELSLDGTLQPIKGVLPMALCARKEGLHAIIVPKDNANEAAVVQGLTVYGMHNLRDVIRFLNGEQEFDPTVVDLDTLFRKESYPSDIDFADVRGQQATRRAIEIAAAGGHNLLMIGPPGAGKSMIAKRIPTILPPLTLEEALETTKIHSVVGLISKRKTATATSLIVQRPFRAPHHTITNVALVGGGQNPHPGEISLAHNGVLFLDELPEYHRSVLEVMRQPLEDRKITVARANGTIDYPASFMLVAAMNPCPCGHYGENNPAHPCTCTPAQVHKYMSKISGPLLDRIDIQCSIQAVPYDQLKDQQPGESSAVMRERVLKARKIQAERFHSAQRSCSDSGLTAQRSCSDSGLSAAGGLIHCNAMMSPSQVRKYCVLNEQCDKILESAMTKLGLSARAYDRILKVARTIADLEGSADIQPTHIMEAISYRSLDRQTFF